MAFPRGVANAGINFILHRLTKGGGPALQQDEPGVRRVRRRRGAGEGGSGDKFGGTRARAAGRGDDAALRGGGKADGGGYRGSHEAQV